MTPLGPVDRNKGISVPFQPTLESLSVTFGLGAGFSSL